MEFCRFKIETMNNEGMEYGHEANLRDVFFLEIVSIIDRPGESDLRILSKAIRENEHSDPH